MALYLVCIAIDLKVLQKQIHFTNIFKSRRIMYPDHTLYNDCKSKLKFSFQKMNVFQFSANNFDVHLILFASKQNRRIGCMQYSLPENL